MGTNIKQGFNTVFEYHQKILKKNSILKKNITFVSIHVNKIVQNFQHYSYYVT